MTTDLTRDRIMELKAGRATDCVIAVQLFGWEDIEFSNITQDWQGTEGCRAWMPVPHYSTSIQDAFKVVEKMREEGWAFTLHDPVTKEWACVLTRPGGFAFGIAPKDEPALAICRAALLSTLPEFGGKAALLAKLR